MSELSFPLWVFLLVVVSFHNSEGYRSYASARQLYSTNSNSNVRSFRQPSNSDYQSLAFKSGFDNAQCLTRDISDGNQSFQIIIERCVSQRPGQFSRRVPSRLEVAKVKGTNRVQISQGYRDANKPYGLAGCLIPERGGVYASKTSCDSNLSHWELKKSVTNANLRQMVHISSGKCLTFPDSGNGVSTSNCNGNNAKQFWEISST